MCPFPPLDSTWGTWLKGYPCVEHKKSTAGDWLVGPGSVRLYAPQGAACEAFLLKFMPSSLPGTTPHLPSPRGPLEPTPWFQERNQFKEAPNSPTISLKWQAQQAPIRKSWVLDFPEEGFFFGGLLEFGHEGISWETSVGSGRSLYGLLDCDGSINLEDKLV